MFLQKGLDENFKLFDIFIRHAWRMVQFLHQNAWSRIMVLMVCCAGHLALNVLKFATACIQWTHCNALGGMNTLIIVSLCEYEVCATLGRESGQYIVPMNRATLATPGTDQL